MTNSKTTKRALLSSVIALILCFSMLLGTTFAWFTDSVSSGVNTITAGNLDIELEYSKDYSTWAPVQDATQLFADVTLWEPGTTSVVYLRMTNKGTLALKYQFSMNIASETTATSVNGSTFKLSEHLKYGLVDCTGVYDDRNDARQAVAGSAESLANYSKNGTMVGKNDPAYVDQYMALVVYMPEDVGNEANYRGNVVPTIELGLNLVAAQLNHESDSFGSDYDTNATFLNTDAQGNYLISNANELVYFAKDVNVNGNSYAGKTVKLTANIDLAGKKWIPVGQTGGYTANTYFQGTFDGNGKTISNLTIPASTWEAGNDNGQHFATGFFGFIDVGNTTIKDVTFDHATVEGHHWVGVAAGYMTGTVSGVKVTNSTITSTWLNNSADGDKAGGVVGYLNSDSSVTGCTVTGSTITAIRDCGSVVGHSVGTVTGNTAQDCTVYYSTDNDEQIGGKIAGKRATGVSGNTATNVTVTKQLLISTAAELSAALNKTYTTDTTIKLANDITLSGEWGVHSLEGSNNAKLVIDGNGKTIYGLTSSAYNSTNGFNSNGLVTAIMSSLSSVTFKNLTVSGANLTNNGGWNAASGVFVGDINTVKVTFDTCTVTGANVTSNAYAAGFVGYVQDVYNTDPNLSCPITLKNCTVINSTFNGGDATGALVGISYAAVTINGATVTGNTINGGAGYSAAALVGTSISGTTATNVTASGNTFEITGSNYQVSNATYGYVYKNGQTYTVDATELN